VAGIRPALLPAAAGAVAVGLVVRALPEAWQIVAGIPIIILVFGAIMWRWGFRPDDRVLFRRTKA
jgi:hypothetical protein